MLSATRPYAGLCPEGGKKTALGIVTCEPSTGTSVIMLFWAMATLEFDVPKSIPQDIIAMSASFLKIRGANIRKSVEVLRFEVLRLLAARRLHFF
jgi:hypothetical protein